MAEQTVSLENLYKLRGDAAMAALETLLKAIKQQVGVLEAVLEQMKTLEEHYQLRRNLNLDAMGELVQTMRNLRPAETEGKSDEEVLALFGGQQG